jgi:sugar O-acyltransferase (sialic acid O-acetyltransferase NeuD family)
MIKIKIPKQNASDDDVIITDIYFKSGEYVDEDDILFEYETSKASFDFEAVNSGFLYYNFLVGDSVLVQTDIAYLSDLELNSDEIKKLFPVSNETNLSEKNITKKALKLINKNSINIKEFKEDLITEKVVKEFLNKLSKKEPTININFNQNDIVIMGIKGHASMCIDILLEHDEFNLVGFIDKFETLDENYNLDYLGSLENLDNLISMGLKNLIIGVGFLNNLKKREKYYDEYSPKINIPTIIHNTAIVEKSAKIQDGSQIMAGAIIGAHVAIDSNCIINSGSIISHDSLIKKSAHITPGAILAGNVTIGQRCLIGMGSTIFFGLTIDDDEIIKNGENVN